MSKLFVLLLLSDKTGQAMIDRDARVFDGPSPLLHLRDWPGQVCTLSCVLAYPSVQSPSSATCFDLPLFSPLLNHHLRSSFLFARCHNSRSSETEGTLAV